MQYKILVDNNALSLSQRIEKAIEVGWELHGGIAIGLMEGGVVFAQALTNEEDAPLPPPIDNRGLAEILADMVKEFPPP